MFPLQTPDTSGYMIAGYVVSFTVMAIYLINLAIRWRNLKQDLAMLESTQARIKPARPAAGRPGAAKRRIAKPKAKAKKKK
jgi:hypothetical protein